MIWGLGVGYVISGMYFGWNLGLPEGGPYGLLVATGVVTLAIGMIALLTGRTGDIILIAVFGALACMVAMTWSHTWHAAIFAGIMVGCWLGFVLLRG